MREIPKDFKNTIIALFIIAIIIIGFKACSGCGSSVSHNDGLCDICGKSAYSKLNGDGGEYCREHYNDALEYYVSQAIKD